MSAPFPTQTDAPPTAIAAVENASQRFGVLQIRLESRVSFVQKKVGRVGLDLTNLDPTN